MYEKKEDKIKIDGTLQSTVYTQLIHITITIDIKLFYYHYFIGTHTQ